MNIDGCEYILCNHDQSLQLKMGSFIENARNYKYNEILKILQNEGALMPFWCGLLNGLYQANPYYNNNNENSNDYEFKFYNTILNCAYYIMNDKNIPTKYNEHGYKIPDLYGRVVYNSIDKNNKPEVKSMDLTDKIFDRYFQNYPRMLRILYELNLRTVDMLFSQISNYIFRDFIMRGNKIEDQEFVFASDYAFEYIFEPIKVTDFDDIFTLKKILDDYVLTNEFGDKYLDISNLRNQMNFNYIKHYNYVEDTITFQYYNNIYAFNVGCPDIKTTLNKVFPNEYKDTHHLSDYINIVESLMFIKCKINGKESLVIPYTIFNNKTCFKIVDDNHPFTLIDITKLSVYSHSNDSNDNDYSSNRFINMYNDIGLRDITNNCHIDIRNATNIDIFDYYSSSFSPIIFYRYNIALLAATGIILEEYSHTKHEYFYNSYDLGINFINEYNVIYHTAIQFHYDDPKNNDSKKDTSVIAIYDCDININLKDEIITVVPTFPTYSDYKPNDIEYRRELINDRFKLIEKRFNDIYNTHKRSIIKTYNNIINKCEKLFRNSDEVLYNGNLENFLMELRFVFNVSIDYNYIKTISLGGINSNENYQ